MSLKFPFIDSAFDRLTSVRLTRDANLGVILNVDPEDLLDGTIWENGAESGAKNITAILAPGQGPVTFTLRVSPSATSSQALIVIAMPKWKPNCCAPVMIPLSTFCPIDATDDTGMVPLNRRLFWQPPGGVVVPPPTSLDFTVTSAGLIRWRHFASVHTMDLSEDGMGTGTAQNTTHLIIMARGEEAAEIEIPRFGSLNAPVTLKL